MHHPSSVLSDGVCRQTEREFRDRELDENSVPATLGRDSIDFPAPYERFPFEGCPTLPNGLSSPLVYVIGRGVAKDFVKPARFVVTDRPPDLRTRNFWADDKVMKIRNNYSEEVFNLNIGMMIRMDSEIQALKIGFAGWVVGHDY